ncbi:MAG TPA: carboxylate-amine ligase [Thermopetrobacter sp.]|nr:carboxylate-amine ligase [Thermopetrobacter sp.]
MNIREPSLTVGIEEEYLLVDLESRDLVAEAPAGLMEEAEAALSGQVSPEFLQCQIEVETRVCRTIAEAREDLRRLRHTLGEIAARHGLAPIAASTHPFADWSRQHFTPKDRYLELARDLQGVGQRMLICGMHVHIGVEDENLRIDLFNQLSYFLPHLLALTTSSPFWQGRDTGLKSYRLTIFDNLPRTGLPPTFDSWAEYQRAVNVLIDVGVIEDATKIWWDLRPSARFPTLEVRICDVCTWLDDAAAVAALVQCLVRMLYRLRRENQRWRQYDRFLVNENRWRAQRYGTEGGLIDFGRGELVPYADLLAELQEMLRGDAEALGCADELAAAMDILSRGSSADRQRAAYRRAREQGADHDEALRAVVDSLVAETVGSPPPVAVAPPPAAGPGAGGGG